MEEKSNQEKVQELLAALKEAGDIKPPKGEKLEDAAELQGPMVAFITKLNALVGDTFYESKKKGLRPGIPVMLVMGGLAFSAANFFHLLTRGLGSSMTAAQYEAHFVDMLRTAIKDIKDNPA